MNLSRIFIERPVMTALVCFAILLFGVIGFPRAAGGRAAQRGLPHHSGERRPCPAPARRPWRRRWPRRSSASFPPSPAFQPMSSVNSQGSTSITVQFTLEPQDRRRGAGHPGGHRARRRAAAHQHAAPAFLPEGESGGAADHLPGARFRHAAASTRWTNTPRPCWPQRISMVGGVSRVQVFGAQKYAVRVQVDPDQLAAHNIGIDEVQTAIATSNTNLPTGTAGWRQAGLHHPIQRHAAERRRIPADHRGLPQRRAGAAGAARQRARRRGERQGGRAGTTTATP